MFAVLGHLAGNIRPLTLLRVTVCKYIASYGEGHLDNSWFSFRFDRQIVFGGGAAVSLSSLIAPSYLHTHSLYHHPMSTLEKQLPLNENTP